MYMKSIDRPCVFKLSICYYKFLVFNKIGRHIEFSKSNIVDKK